MNILRRLLGAILLAVVAIPAQADYSCAAGKIAHYKEYRANTAPAMLTTSISACLANINVYGWPAYKSALQACIDGQPNSNNTLTWKVDQWQNEPSGTAGGWQGDAGFTPSSVGSFKRIYNSNGSNESAGYYVGTQAKCDVAPACPTSGTAYASGAAQYSNVQTPDGAHCVTDTASGLKCGIVPDGPLYQFGSSTGETAKFKYSGQTCGSSAAAEALTTPASACTTLEAGTQACRTNGGMTVNGRLVDLSASDGSISSNGASIAPGSPNALDLGAAAADGRFTTPNTSSSLVPQVSGQPATPAAVVKTVTNNNGTTNTYNYYTRNQVINNITNNPETPGEGDGDGEEETQSDAVEGPALDPQVPSIGDSTKAFYNRVRNAPAIAAIGNLHMPTSMACPTYQLPIPYLNTTVNFTAQCTVAESIRSILYIIMLVIFSIIAVRVFLEA